MSIKRHPNRREVMKRFFWTGLAAGTGLIAPSPWSLGIQAASNRVPRTFKFNLSLDDEIIGTHKIHLKQDDATDVWRHETNINIRVSLGIFGDITYDHRCIEEWDQGRLLKLSSNTDDDGEKFQVSGQTDGDEFVTVGPNGRYRSPGRLMTTNGLWTESFCNQEEVIDAVTGGVIGVVIDPITTRRRRRKENQRQLNSYDVVSAKITGELLYDSAGIWSGGILQKSGQEIEYEQIQ